MPYKKLAVAVVAAALMISSCTMSYPQSGVATPIPTNPFTRPLPTDSEPMSQVEGFATGTAMAKTAMANGEPTGTPTPTEEGGGLTISTATPTLGVDLATPTATLDAGVSTSTPIPPTQIVGRPATYTLQSGEHPYCIARRFNVDPDALLALSGLTRAQANSLMAGTVLKIPQSGSFPGERALRPHPPGTIYTVTGVNDTNLYAVACIYGDVDPVVLAQINNLSLSAALTVGQKITIQ